MGRAMATSSGTGRATITKAESVLRSAGVGAKACEIEKGTVLFHQGDRAEAMYFLLQGRVRLTVTVPGGREATVTVLGAGDVFGERCLTPLAVRAHTACTLTRSSLIKVDAATALVTMAKDVAVAKYILDRLVTRMNSYESTLVHHITNNSEQRLARVLLQLAHYNGYAKSLKAVEGVSQAILSEMVGTTRPRINSFMNKFRRLGWIDYFASSIVVKPELVKVLLNEDSRLETAD